MIEFIAGSSSITVKSPQYGYIVDLYLSLVIEQFCNTIDSWDNGITYDHREVTFDLLLSESESVNLRSFFNNSIARDQKFTLKCPNNSKFFVAGPDKGDSGEFTVSLAEPIKESEMKLEPFKYFLFSFHLLIHATPETIIPTQRNEGSFTIGSVNGLMYPKITPNKEDGVIRSKTLSGDLGSINIGRKADTYKTKIIQYCNVSKAAALVNFLQSNTARGNGIYIQAPSNYYLFGASCGDHGNYSVKLLNNVIPIKYYDYDRYSIDLELCKI